MKIACKMCRYILCVLGLIFTLSAGAVESTPWVGWRKAYECYNKAGAFKEAGDIVQAAEFYRRGRDHFAGIRRDFPDWNKSVVEGRIRLCENALREMQSILAAGNSVPAARSGSSTVNVPREMPPVNPVREPQNSNYAAPERRNNTVYPEASSYNNVGSTGYSPAPGYSGSGNSSRLYIEMQSEIDQYRQRLRNALMEIDALQIKLQRSESRSRDIDGVLRDYRLLQEKYSLLEMQYKNAMQRAVSGDRERYENQIVTLKQANDEALKYSRELENTIRTKDQEYALSRTEVLKLQDAQQKLSNENRRLQREVELLRNRPGAAAGGVAAAEYAGQLEQLNSELKRKDQRIDRLMKLLSEDPADKSGANSALIAEIKRLQQEVDSLQKSSAADSELRRRISDLTVAESILKKQLADANELLKVRTNELNSMRQGDSKTQNELTAAQGEIKKLQERIAVADKELKAFAARYSVIEKRHQDRLRADALNQEQLTKARLQAEKSAAELQKKLLQLQGDLQKSQRELAEAQKLIKTSRSNVIELTAKQHSSEIELRKMSALQKAYDELKARFDLIKQASNSDVLTALNRIPGLEESLKRYEKENRSLLDEVNSLKKALLKKSGVKNAPALAAEELNKLETLLADARSAEARGNMEIAVWGYRQVLARDEDNLEASAGLGNIYLRSGRFDEAAKLLRVACRKKPVPAGLLNSYARALIGKRDYAGALKLIAEYKKQSGKAGADILLTEALAFSRSGQAQAAEKAFKAVLKLIPGNAEAAYELALMLSADEKRRNEAGEFYMLAKENGIGVDSYLEELLRSFSNHDTATRDFLLGNVRESLEKSDTASAQWYMTEAVKMFAKDKTVEYMQNIMYIFNRQSGEVVKKLAKSNAAGDKFLYALALLQSNQADAAEKMLTDVPMQKAGAETALLKKFIQQQLAAAQGKNKKLAQELLKKLP